MTTIEQVQLEAQFGGSKGQIKIHALLEDVNAKVGNTTTCLSEVNDSLKEMTRKQEASTTMILSAIAQMQKTQIQLAEMRNIRNFVEFTKNYMSTYPHHNVDRTTMARTVKLAKRLGWQQPDAECFKSLTPENDEMGYMHTVFRPALEVLDQATMHRGAEYQGASFQKLMEF